MKITKNNSRLRFQRNPVWSGLAHLRQQQIPTGLRGALLCRDSLTAKIKKSCHGDFAVSVVSQAWERPLYEEWQALGIRRDEQAIVRQVLLKCSDTAWVFARSVVPAVTLRNYQRLSLLGNKPLGELLFRERSMRRGEMEVAMIRSGQPLYGCAAAAVGDGEIGDSLWGRRSLFFVKGCPLLVCELFLPRYGENQQCLSS